MSRDTRLLIFILCIIGFAGWIVFPGAGKPWGRDQFVLGLELSGGTHLIYQIDMTNVKPADRDSVAAGIKGVVEQRVNVLGVTEPLVQTQKSGEDYNVILQLPKVSESDQAKKLATLPTLLEFREQDDTGNWIPAKGKINNEERALTSNYFKENTYVDLQSVGGVIVVFNWNDEGKILSREITGRLVGKPLGIYVGDEPMRGEDGHAIAPIVQSVIEESGQIEGLSPNDATTLSKLLNVGRIAAPLGVWQTEGGKRVFKVGRPLYEKNVSAVLGEQFIERSLLAGIIGLALVALFMVLYYRLPGLLAALALAVYVVVVMMIYKMIPVTLTLAGIAGFILSIGMAVDANVLIFERLKEELRDKKGLKTAIELGFNRAWSAIWDSNLTTLLACVILFLFGRSTVVGSPQVLGFATTLFIGVVLSLFSAIMVTKTFLRLASRTGLSKKLNLFGVASKDV
ncbi:MAG: protein translocase subunit SecD [Chloroflexota bacterium]